MKRELAIVTIFLSLSASAYAQGLDSFYKLGPDSLEHDGVPHGKFVGPLTLPCKVYPGTAHTYWVYVPAQYDGTKPASLMIFNDGQAFKNEKGDIACPECDRQPDLPPRVSGHARRIHQPRENARTAGADTPRNGATARPIGPTEYNTPDDKYARIICDELMPVLYKDYNISKDPEQHGIGGASSGAHRRLFGRLGAAQRIPQSAEHRRQLRQSARRPRLSRTRSGQREKADPRLSFKTAATTTAARARAAITTRNATGSIKTSASSTP